MGVPNALLAEADSLHGPITDVSIVLRAIRAAHRDARPVPDRDGSDRINKDAERGEEEVGRGDEPPAMRVGDARDQIVAVTRVWLERSEQLKQRLFEYGQEHPADLDDVTARIAGLSMLDIAVASDVALVAAIDEAAEEDLVSTAIGIWEESDPAPNIRAVAFGESHLLHSLFNPLDDEDPSDDSAASEFVIDEVVKDLVDRGG